MLFSLKKEISNYSLGFRILRNALWAIIILNTKMNIIVIQIKKRKYSITFRYHIG